MSYTYVQTPEIDIRTFTTQLHSKGKKEEYYPNERMRINFYKIKQIFSSFTIHFLLKLSFWYIQTVAKDKSLHCSCSNNYISCLSVCLCRKIHQIIFLITEKELLYKHPLYNIINIIRKFPSNNFLPFFSSVLYLLFGALLLILSSF